MEPACSRRSTFGFVYLLLIVIVVSFIFAAHGTVGAEQSAVADDSMNDPGVQSVCLLLDPSPNLDQFIDPLPLMAMVDVSTGVPVVLKAYAIQQKLHRDLPPTTLYAFGTNESNACYPGPALQAKWNVPSCIRWENHISHDKHFLPVDYTIGAPSLLDGGVPIVTHLHGMELESIYDGHPEAWFTKSGEKGHTYATQDYRYPNTVRPTMLWYHDHTIGMTRLNVAAGLTGPYIVRGAKHEEPSGMPTGDQEIFLLIQDKQFFPNGSINFPSVGNDPSVHPVWCPGYYGDVMIVNGKIWPYHEVLPFKYRLRIVNANSERYLSLEMTHNNESLLFHKIGTDGGYLRSSVELDHIVLAPGERVDCIVDFSGLQPGDSIVLNNTANTPYPGGFTLSPEDKMRAVLQFRVVANSTADKSMIPEILSNYKQPVLPSPNCTRFRHFTLDEVINNVGNATQLLIANKTFDDPTTEIAHLGATEIWQFIGLTPQVAHPMHIHLIKFHVLDVQPLNASAYMNSECSIETDYGQDGSCFLGPSRPPDDQEIGWKDVVSAWPDTVTRIVVTFRTQDGTPFHFNPTGGPGYVWHCHLLSHEDNSMMRPLCLVT